MRRCAIIDIDGTIADNQHRVHFLKQTPKDWTGFYSAAIEDKPYPYMVELCRMLEMSRPPILVLLCTSRPEKYRTQTVIWLAQHKVLYNRLIMRPSGNYLSPAMVKAAMLQTIKTEWDILFAIDDHPDVAETFRKNGVPVLMPKGVEWVV